jgi:biopolymer transport protein ExbB
MLDRLSSALPPFAHPLADLVEAGGPVVLLLLLLSVAALAIVLGKVLQFQVAGIGRHTRGHGALKAWLEGRKGDAGALLKGDRTVLGEVAARLVAASMRRNTDPSSLREDIERVCRNRLAELRAYLRALDMIAQTAPLIGLFGTVIGMIEAFRGMQGAGAAVDPSVLAGGIWVALLTTAVGLAIAIPVSAITGWLDGRLEREQVAMASLVTAFFTGAVAEPAASAEEPALVGLEAGHAA